MESMLSLSYYTVPELTALDTVKVAAKTGCTHVGLRLLGGQPGKSEMPLLAQKALRRELRRLMEDCGIGALDANTARLVPESEIDMYLPFLDAAHELGARHVLTTVDDHDRNRVQDNLVRLCDFAQERELTVDLEFVPWLKLSSVYDAGELVTACDHSALGITVDALHFHRSNASPTVLERMPRGWFRYMQLCDISDDNLPQCKDDYIHEATQERLAPGDGVIDLMALLGALSKGIPIALEVPQARLAALVPAEERTKRLVTRTQTLLARLGQAAT